MVNLTTPLTDGNPQHETDKKTTDNHSISVKHGLSVTLNNGYNILLLFDIFKWYWLFFIYSTPGLIQFTVYWISVIYKFKSTHKAINVQIAESRRAFHILFFDMIFFDETVENTTVNRSLILIVLTYFIKTT